MSSPFENPREELAYLLGKAEEMTSHRLARVPNAPLLKHVDAQLGTIRESLARRGPLSPDLFERINIGLVALKELQGLTTRRLIPNLTYYGQRLDPNL